ncbi:MAG TPA: VTT domain-containing protein, partial [Kofleriaceae bacterium]|nr:VTT domain-containing protein [Kofleriaceae bacterium]
MGSVVYLGRGSRRDQAGAPARDAASLLRPGYNCWRVSPAGRVALLIDAKDYFEAFHRAALKAERSILILAWDFNSRTRLHFDPVPRGGPPAELGEFLNYLVRRRRGLHIHILNWDYPMVFGADREFPPLYGFGWKPAHRVHLRYDDTHPLGGSQHQKVVVIDDAIAFSGGIDLTVRRWDSTEHAASDERRKAYDKPYPPFHDLMVAVDGEAAASLGELARERWLAATGQHLIQAKGMHEAWPEHLAPDASEVEVGIARTLPPRGEAPAVKEVERLYLDMIAAARHTLYIENQYFTAPRIAAALEKRLAEPDGPEIALVVRLLSHGWLEEATMHVLRTRLIQRLQKADRYGRFRVYYPHVPGLDEGCCVDVHSKLMIVDDRVLRIGSSNLCNRSMGVDSECDVVLEALGRPHVASAIRDFREQVVAEHLNVPPPRLREALGGANGSLHGAIAALAAEGRSMRQLTELPDWPEALVNVAAVADPEEPIALQALLDEREIVEQTAKGTPAWGKLFLLLSLVIGLTLLWRATPLAHVVSPQNVIEWAKDFGLRWWSPLAVMALFTPACLVMFPRPLITLAAVIAFGPVPGFLYSLLGITASSVVTYYIGRRMRRDTVRRLAGEKLDRMAEVLKKYGLLAMTLLRLVPLAPFAVESIVAGAIHMKVWHVAAGTAIGLLPGTLATTIFGDQIETALSGGAINWWVVGSVLG